VGALSGEGTYLGVGGICKTEEGGLPKLQWRGKKNLSWCEAKKVIKLKQRGGSNQGAEAGDKRLAAFYGRGP